MWPTLKPLAQLSHQPLHSLILLPILLLAGCFSELSLTPCSSAQQCPERAPLCVDGACFHHSLTSPFKWCEGGADTGENCCPLLEPNGLASPPCSARQQPGTLLAQPVLAYQLDRFLVLAHRGGASVLLEFSSAGKELHAEKLPLDCTPTMPARVAQWQQATWVACGSNNWFIAPNLDSPALWTWPHEPLEVEAGALVGEAVIVMPSAEGLMVHRPEVGITDTLALDGTAPWTPGLNVVADPQAGLVYVPANGFGRVTVLEIPSGRQVAELSQDSLGGEVLAMALDDQGGLWVLTADGTASLWAWGDGNKMVNRFTLDGVGRRSPKAGSFALSAGGARYIGTDGTIVWALAGAKVAKAQPLWEDLVATIDLAQGAMLVLQQGPNSGSSRVTALFDAFEPAWHSNRSGVTTSADFACDAAELSPATLDGVALLRCNNELIFFATPAQGPPLPWGVHAGQGNSNCRIGAEPAQ